MDIFGKFERQVWERVEGVLGDAWVFCVKVDQGSVPAILKARLDRCP